MSDNNDRDGDNDDDNKGTVENCDGQEAQTTATAQLPDSDTHKDIQQPAKAPADSGFMLLWIYTSFYDLLRIYTLLL